MIAPRRVLLLTAAGLAAWHDDRAGLRCVARFGADAAGQAAFADYLQRHRYSRFLILADIADETYHQEDLPHVSRSERAAIIHRMIDRHCAFTALAAAIHQGRRDDGRRDDRFLFSALIQPRLFAPWREALAGAGAALVGIYSAAQAVAALAHAVPASAATRLLVTFDGAGLRQTYFVDGRLRFSRLTPLDEDIGGCCAIQAVAFRQYLAGRRLLDPTEPLAVDVVAAGRQADALRAACRDDAELRFAFHDIDTVARRCRFRRGYAEHADGGADALLVRSLLRATPAAQFAPDEDLHNDRRRHMRWVLGGLGLGTAAVLLALVGLQAAELRRLDTLTADLRGRTTAIERDWQSAQPSAAPGLPPPTALRDMVRRNDQLSGQAAGPLPFYRKLAAALDAVPEIEIERIDWSFAAGSPATSSQTSPPVAAGEQAVADIYGRLPLRLRVKPQTEQALLEAFASRLAPPRHATAHWIEHPGERDAQLMQRGDGELAALPSRFVLRIALPL